MDIYERVSLHDVENIDDSIILDHSQREKGRLKTVSTSGELVRLFLERGNTLKIGEILKSDCGKYLQVDGAPEEVITANAQDWQTFSRACYHLGNRHVKIQVGERWLRIKPDHVLSEMLEELGLKVKEELAVFIPESGAYSRGGHKHNDAHHQGHSHDHHTH